MREKSDGSVETLSQIKSQLSRLLVIETSDGISKEKMRGNGVRYEYTFKTLYFTYLRRNQLLQYVPWFHLLLLFNPFLHNLVLPFNPVIFHLVIESNPVLFHSVLIKF